MGFATSSKVKAVVSMLVCVVCGIALGTPFAASADEPTTNAANLPASDTGNPTANDSAASDSVSANGTTDSQTSNRNGWVEENGARYWYDNGVIARSKEVFDPGSKAWYWFDADGTMAHDKDVFVPSNGGKWVRYDSNGHMVKGEDYRYGGWYYFDPVTGTMQKGMVYVPNGNKWVYYDPITGQMRHDLQYINGAWYYFDHYTGKMAHKMTWVPEWGAFKYFDDLDGRWNPGQETVDWTASSQEGGYPDLSKVGNLNVQVDIAAQQVYVRDGDRVIYAMMTSTGLHDSTPRGDYRINGRGNRFMNPTGVGANNWVRIKGDYLFHSVPISRNGDYLLKEAAKLGRPASHGCVRLTIPDSRWLFDQLRDGTPVHIY